MISNYSDRDFNTSGYKYNVMMQKVRYEILSKLLSQFDAQEFDGLLELESFKFDQNFKPELAPEIELEFGTEFELELGSEIEPELAPESEKIDNGIKSYSSLFTDDDIDQLRTRFSKYASMADQYEAEIYSDIGNYILYKTLAPLSHSLQSAGFQLENWKPVEISAVVDWVDLEFVIDPMKCALGSEEETRRKIKAFLALKTATKFYIDVDRSRFRIRIHDVYNKQSLLKVFDLLSRQYGVDVNGIAIVGIELALDFNHVPNNGFLVALHKSAQYRGNSENFRVYKTDKVYTPVPDSPLMLMHLFDYGYNLAVGHRDHADIRYHIYHKVTDNNKQPLSPDRHRHRFEITLNKKALESFDCQHVNMSKVIGEAFKMIKFTRLSKRANEDDRSQYRKCVLPFGMEQMTKSKHGHRRNLHETIEVHGALNELKRGAVRKLVERFNV